MKQLIPVLACMGFAQTGRIPGLSAARSHARFLMVTKDMRGVAK